MSDPVTAPNGAVFEGYVRITERALLGMITLRADMAEPAVQAALSAATGVQTPVSVRAVAAGRTCQVGWMSPDEVLILCDYADAAGLAATLRDALVDQHALVCVVSEARAAFDITGADCREVIAKLCPVDMAPVAFPAGQIRRTRLGQVAAAIWIVDAETVHVICYRSVARYVFDVLSQVSRTNARAGLFDGTGEQTTPRGVDEPNTGTTCHPRDTHFKET